MKHPPALRALIIAVALAAGITALPLFAQQAGLTLEGLSTRIDVLFSGQQYLTHRIAALETAVASQRQVAAVPLETPTPIPTQAIPTATSTPIPTLSPIPTETATRVPSATPTESSAQLLTDRRLSLRRGPGNSYSIVTYVEPNSQLDITGRNLAGTWVQVSYGEKIGWLPATYAEGVSGIPIVATPTPMPTSTARPTRTPVPTPTLEQVSQELWDRLKEVAQADVEAAEGRTLNQEELLDVIVKYFDHLNELMDFCDMTRDELLDLIEPYAQQIDESGISERTGYWSRWSLLNGMIESETMERLKCSQYLEEFADWVMWKYREKE